MATPTSQAQEKEKAQKDKKEKKKNAAASEEGGKKNKGGKAAPAAEDAGEPVPSMIDLRVGHIVDGKIIRYDPACSNLVFFLVVKHPDADGLYIEVG